MINQVTIVNMYRPPLLFLHMFHALLHTMKSVGFYCQLAYNPLVNIYLIGALQKTALKAFTTSEDSTQPTHSRSIIWLCNDANEF